MPEAETPDAPAPVAPRRRIQPEMLVGLAALAVSVCAVTVSIYEASLERQHARAAAWPHVELTMTVSPAGMKIEIGNSGIGPAAVDSIQFSVDGRVAGRWTDVFTRLLERMPERYNVTTVTGRVLRPGDTIPLLELPPDVIPADIMTRLPHVAARICYRSVFDERWLLTIDKLTGNSQWTSTSSCPPQASAAVSF
jgi:hypothetical protein